MTQDRYAGYRELDSLLDKAGIKAEDEITVSVEPDASVDLVRFGFQTAGANPQSTVRFTDTSLEALKEHHGITVEMILSLPAKRF